ncbi:MAG: PIN domain-containing protein [Pirellulaceae bacterium]|nr:PIN domain-containing protein [Pirellulaceae bacterium]
MGIVIDTGVFIRWERDGRDVDLKQWESFGEPCVSVITESELKVGIHRANSDERRAKRSLFIATVLSYVTVLQIDSVVADIHARIVAELSSKGTAIGPHDYWIAATVMKYDYDLLTTNVSEFQRVPNLRVLDYRNTS